MKKFLFDRVSGMSLKTKLLMLPMIIAVLFAGTSITIYGFLQSISSYTTGVVEVLTPVAKEASDMEVNVIRQDQLIETYLRTGEETVVDDITHLERESEAIVTRVLKLGEQAQYHAAFRELEQQMQDRYAAFLDGVVGATREIKAHETSVLSEVSPRIERLLSAMSQPGETGGDQRTAFAALLSLQSFMKAKLYLDEYLLYHQEADAERMAEEISAAENRVRSLEQGATGEIHKRDAVSVSEALKAYSDHVMAIASLVRKRDNLVRSLTHEEGPAIVNGARELKKVAHDTLGRDGAYMQELVSVTENTLLTATLIAIIAGILLAVLVARMITRALAQASEVARRISDDDLDVEVVIEANDETGDLLRALENMRDQLRTRQENDRRTANEAFRVRAALDNAQTNVMVVDDAGEIVYLNSAIVDMFREAQADIRKDLPGFDADNLSGSNFDELHRDPGHQHGLADRLTSSHKAEIKIGGRQFTLVSNPVVDHDGRQLGSVVEWEDRTREVDIETEVAHIVAAAGSGDLSGRIELDGKEKFFKSLSEGINQLLDLCEGITSDMARIFDAMSRGDLTQKIENSYDGAFGKLKKDANETVEGMIRVISDIRASADAVASAASEITIGNQSLSQRTEEQASSLEETAASMEEMTGSVRQNAENARLARETANDVHKRATEGGEVVSRVVTAMNEISHSSRKIVDIISVIDEIAFQTNLLALNAAVEAARAGEQGRGFAVVASEVRSLAQRSASAAKEINELIKDSASQVDEGVVLVSASGESMEGIVDSIREMTQLVGEIAVASEEQSNGIEQVNAAVIQLDEMTQQNAALVEEAASASESMAEQAVHMNRRMAFFSVGQETRHNAAPRMPGKARHNVPATPDSRYSAIPPSGTVARVDEDWEEF